MSHWKATLAYDGTPYNGWQIQPSLPTVQGTLAQAIQRVTGESVLPQGSGRTDTGVHALAQVATFSITVPIPPTNLHRALNRALPPSIRVISIESAPDDFHARHSALRKTYEYRIFPRIPYPPTIPPTLERICPPTLAPYVWDCPLPLDFAILQNAADHIRGTHDFTSFAAVDPDLSSRKNPDPDASEDPDVPRPDSGAWVPGSATNPRTPNISSLPNRSSVISTGGGASAAAAEKPASLPRLLTGPDSAILPNRSAVISTGGGASAAAAEKPASLPRLLTGPDSATPHTQLPAPPLNLRTIHHSSWHRQDGIFIYRVTGSGFLHHMVRNLVGTFVEAAAGRISADDIPTILAACSRSAAGPTAPARGLFLVEVEY